MVTKNFFLPVCIPLIKRQRVHFPCPCIWADLMTCFDKECGGRGAVPVLSVDLQKPDSFWFCCLRIQLPCCKEVQAPFLESEAIRRGPRGWDSMCKKSMWRKTKAPQPTASAKASGRLKKSSGSFLPCQPPAKCSHLEWPQVTPCGTEPFSQLKEWWEKINCCCFKPLHFWIVCYKTMVDWIFKKFF